MMNAMRSATRHNPPRRRSPARRCRPAADDAFRAARRFRARDRRQDHPQGQAVQLEGGRSPAGDGHGAALPDRRGAAQQDDPAARPRGAQGREAGLVRLDARRQAGRGGHLRSGRRQARVPARRQEDASPRQAPAAGADDEGRDRRLRSLVRLSHRQRRPSDRLPRRHQRLVAERPGQDLLLVAVPGVPRPPSRHLQDHGPDQEPEGQVRVLRHAAARDQGCTRGRAQDLGVPDRDPPRRRQGSRASARP